MNIKPLANDIELPSDSDDTELLSESDDECELFPKLGDYCPISNEYFFKNALVGDHFRYTSNKYREKGRKMSYSIIKKILPNRDLMVNGYKSNFPDWCIKQNDRYKQYKFYMKPESGHNW